LHRNLIKLIKPFKFNHLNQRDQKIRLNKSEHLVIN
jgi:hypothetical protein